MRRIKVVILAPRDEVWRVIGAEDDQTTEILPCVGGPKDSPTPVRPCRL
jgi:hypothetical protein